MPYQLPPDLEGAFALEVASGRYLDMEHALRQALAALNARDAETAAILQGWEALQQGRLRPLREFDREFREAHNIPLNA